MVNPIIFGCEGLALTPSERSFFKGFPPKGFNLFKLNCNTKTQEISLINSLRDLVVEKVPILIDQEGGGFKDYLHLYGTHIRQRKYLGLFLILIKGKRSN